MSKPEDNATVEIIESPIQDVSLTRFDALRRNDILFIDSTHIVKTGSDVAYDQFRYCRGYVRP